MKTIIYMIYLLAGINVVMLIADQFGSGIDPTPLLIKTTFFIIFFIFLKLESTPIYFIVDLKKEDDKHEENKSNN